MQITQEIEKEERQKKTERERDSRWRPRRQENKTKEKTEDQASVLTEYETTMADDPNKSTWKKRKKKNNMRAIERKWTEKRE